MTVALAERLPMSHVHVWQCDLRVPDATLNLYRRNLHPGERRQAQTIVSASARRRFIVRRAFRHVVIGKYLSRSSWQVVFGRGSDGKPFAVGARRGLHFSCSHSGELAVIAVNRSAEIGIDLERKRPIQEVEEIVRYFSLAPVAPSQSADAVDADKFFMEWTRLEAGVKCLRVGLSKVDPAKIKDLFKHTIFLCHRGEEYALSIACKEFLWNIIIFHQFRSRYRATIPVQEQRLASRQDCGKINLQGDSYGR